MSQPRPRRMGWSGGLCGSVNLRDGERAEQADAIEFAAVQHHLGEARQVVGGGEHAGVPGHAAHVTRGRVVHHAAQRRAVLSACARWARCAAAPSVGRRQEHRLLHAQRQEHVLPRVIGEQLAAEPVHDLAQQDEIDVAINEAHAGRTGRLGGAGQADAGVVAGPGRFERHVGLQAREMREQVAQVMSLWPP